MGANAVTTVPVYTSGEVLTAADLNITNSGIPVFADSTARDNSFGGTGEKVLAEGQYAYLESTKQTLVYDGSDWVSVGTSPGLVFIKSQVIGTTVGSVTVSDAFSATYDNYKIILSDGVGSAVSCNLNMKFGATATGYYWSITGRTFANADDSVGAANQASFRAGAGSPKTLNIKMDVLAPFLSTETNFSGQYQVSTTTGSAVNFGGFLDDTTSYTAFTLTPTAGTLTGGIIRVYGYQNSQDYLMTYAEAVVMYPHDSVHIQVDGVVRLMTPAEYEEFIQQQVDYVPEL